MTAVEWISPSVAEWSRTRRVLGLAKGRTPMKEIVFYQRNPTDADRVDEIRVPSGVTLRSTGDERNRPFVVVASVVDVAFVREQPEPEQESSDV